MIHYNKEVKPLSIIKKDFDYVIETLQDRLNDLEAYSIIAILDKEDSTLNEVQKLKTKLNEDINTLIKTFSATNIVVEKLEKTSPKYFEEAKEKEVSNE